jgi:hypothetical protein
MMHEISACVHMHGERQRGGKWEESESARARAREREREMQEHTCDIYARTFAHTHQKALGFRKQAVARDGESIDLVLEHVNPLIA